MQEEEPASAPPAGGADPLEAHLAACVQESLALHLYPNAAFLAERLAAEFPSEANVFLLATVYQRSGQAHRALHLLRGLPGAQSRYLFAVAAVELGKLPEAEAALAPGGDAARIPNGAAGYCLLGRVYQLTNRHSVAVAYYSAALQLDPMMWAAFEALCALGADHEAAAYLAGGAGGAGAGAGFGAEAADLEGALGRAPEEMDVAGAAPAGAAPDFSFPAAATPAGAPPSPAPLAGARGGGGGLGGGGAPATGDFVTPPMATAGSAPPPAPRNAAGGAAGAPPPAGASPMLLGDDDAGSGARPPRFGGGAAAKQRKVSNKLFAEPASVLRRLAAAGAAGALAGGGASGGGATPAADGAALLAAGGAPGAPRGARSAAGGARARALLHALGAGHRLLASYRCREALDAFARLPPAHAETGWALTQVARCHFELVDYVQATRAYMAARAADPTRLAGIEHFSTVLWHARAEPALAGLAADAVAADRLSPAAWCAMGNCFSLQKEHETALRFFRRALQLDPAQPYPYTLCGHEYFANEDFEQASSAASLSCQSMQKTANRPTNHSPTTTEMKIAGDGMLPLGRARRPAPLQRLVRDRARVLPAGKVRDGGVPLPARAQDQPALERAALLHGHGAGQAASRARGARGARRRGGRRPAQPACALRARGRAGWRGAARRGARGARRAARRRAARGVGAVSHGEDLQAPRPRRRGARRLLRRARPPAALGRHGGHQGRN